MSTPIQIGKSLSYGSAQTLTQTEKTQLVANWPEAVSEHPGLAPRFTAKSFLQPDGTSTVADQLVVMGVGDSIGATTSVYLQELLGKHKNVAGVALLGGRFSRQAGPDIEGHNVSLEPRRYDVWPTGKVYKFLNGASANFGVDKAGIASGMRATLATVYLIDEAGGGTVKIEKSIDEGASWVVLDAAVSTDTGGVQPKALIKNYVVSAGDFTMLRLTSVTGTFECVGMRLLHETVNGTVNIVSATSSARTDLGMAADVNVVDPIMQDLNPDLILFQMYEKTAEMTAGFNGFVNLFNDSLSGSADLVWMLEQNIDATTRAANPDVNPETNRDYVLANVASHDNLALWDTYTMFGSLGRMTETGWFTADGIHPDHDAWRYQASMIAKCLGLEATSELKFKLSGNSTTYGDFYRTSEVSGRDNSLEILGDPDQNTTFKLGYLDAVEGIGGLSIVRHQLDDADNPGGWSFYNQTPAGGRRSIQVSAKGRIYTKEGADVDDVDSFGGRIVSTELTTGFGCFLARGLTVTDYLFKGRNESEATNKDRIWITSNGDIVSPYMQAFDDDTAAAALPAGTIYQTTGSGAAPLNVAGIVMIKQ